MVRKKNGVILELNDEPLYKLTLPGRKAPIQVGFQYPRRGVWAPWENKCVWMEGGYHLLNTVEEAEELLLVLHTAYRYPDIDVWAVESDSVGYRDPGLSIAHRFRLKDRIYQSNVKEYAEFNQNTRQFQNAVYSKLEREIHEYESQRKQNS